MSSPKKDIPKKRKTTIKDVAQDAMVSVATVSYVLNNTGSVGPTVKKKVLNSAEKLGYIPNRSAQAMRTGKTQTLGLILPDLCNPFFPELAQSIENAAREAGYSVILIDTQGNKDVEEQGVERLVRHRVDGIIWCPTIGENTLSHKTKNVPTVMIDRSFPNYDFVRSDDAKGGEMIADYVLSRGHRSIGVISGPLSLLSAKSRHNGFIEKIAQKAKIKWEIENDFSVHLSESVREILSKSCATTAPTVIVCGNDLIAIGAMRELHRFGKKIPEDISVIGFDDIPWADIVTPGLTTIRQPISDLGQEATNLLLRRISDANASLKQLILGVRLIERNSVRNLAHET